MTKPLLPTLAEKFRHDPRIEQAKKLIREALVEHQKNVRSLTQPNEALLTAYQERIQSFGELRAGKLFYPYLGSGFGKGALVELLDGSVKYDMISGVGPHFWGHSCPEMILASIDGALEDSVMQGNLQQNETAFELSKLLCEASGLDHCFLSTSGAMACENALKICFQNRFPASRILAFDHCFMGRTMALSQITDKPTYRDGLPTLLNVDYLPFYDPKEPEASTKKTIQRLHEHLERYPKQHALMALELIQGEGGFNVGSRDFFKRVLDGLKKEGILVFVDEVQTFGRTPELFAFQHFELHEETDVVSIGKLSQTCATLFRGKLKPKAGLLSQTFISSSAALKASLWGIKNLMTGGYYGKEGKLSRLHARFEAAFKRIEKEYPGSIEGPYGVGAMIAFTPFGGEKEKVMRFVQTLFREGIIAFVAGSDPTRVRFLIPGGGMEEEDVDEVMRIVERVILKEV